MTVFFSFSLSPSLSLCVAGTSLAFSTWANYLENEPETREGEREKVQCNKRASIERAERRTKRKEISIELRLTVHSTEQFYSSRHVLKVQSRRKPVSSSLSCSQLTVPFCTSIHSGDVQLFPLRSLSLSLSSCFGCSFCMHSLGSNNPTQCSLVSFSLSSSFHSPSPPLAHSFILFGLVILKFCSGSWFFSFSLYTVPSCITFSLQMIQWALATQCIEF